MLRFFDSKKINISQGIILDKLARYLELSKGQADYDPVIVENLIGKLLDPDGGYCSGFATVAGYSQWLEHQPQRMDDNNQPIPRDDWQWLELTLKRIAQWDGQSLPPKELANDIERLISLIEFYHNVENYLPLVGQGALEKNLEDTHGRKAVKEYSLAGLLTLEKLEKILPQILHEDRLLLITSSLHDISLLKHEGMISLNDTTRKSYDETEIKKIAKDIFDIMTFDQAKPSLLGFRSFSFDGKPMIPYPLQANLLKDLPLMSNDADYSNNNTALYMAARIGCVESVKFYTQNVQPDYLNQANNRLTTPALIAAQNGHVEVLQILADKGADFNKANIDDVTPAFVAAENGDVNALRILASHGANLNQADIDGGTPAFVAAGKGNMDALKFLASHGANVDQANNDGFTPAFVAAQNGRLETLQFLAKQGVNLHQENNGITPVLLAKQQGHRAVVDFIQSLQAPTQTGGFNP